VNNHELQHLTIANAAERFRKGTLSPIQLMEAIFERIDETESKINAYVTICREESLRQAKIAESQINSGVDLGTLHGIPIAIKDVIETEGIRTAAGSKIFSNFVPKQDATVIGRLKSGGAIIIGKTQAHEFALDGPVPTRNPWNLDKIAGGSSSGSAAAVAISSCLGALGTDTGGSIREPASFCGLVGLKPTYGRVSKTGVIPASWSLDHVGPITKSVRDCALILESISGYDRSDPASTNGRVSKFTADLDGEISNLRIGIPENYFFEEVDDEVLSTVRKAIQELEALGAQTSSINFPMAPEIMDTYSKILFSEVSAYHETFFRERSQDYSQEARSLIELGFFIPAVQYIRAQRLRGLLMKRVLELFVKVDLIVTPTLPIIAPNIGTTRVMINDIENDLGVTTRNLAPFNLLGLPAITLPCGFSIKGLPIGMQIIGRPFEESTLLRLSNCYEKATNWNDRSPVY